MCTPICTYAPIYADLPLPGLPRRLFNISIAVIKPTWRRPRPDQIRKFDDGVYIQACSAQPSKHRCTDTPRYPYVTYSTSSLMEITARVNAPVCIHHHSHSHSRAFTKISHCSCSLTSLTLSRPRLAPTALNVTVLASHRGERTGKEQRR